MRQSETIPKIRVFEIRILDTEDEKTNCNSCLLPEKDKQDIMKRHKPEEEEGSA